MTAIGFIFASFYLAYFYFLIDYGVEKEMLFIPLFARGFASVVISIVFVTSIVQSGLPFTVFPQALTINGFTGAVMGATLGAAVVGEILNKVTAKNVSLLSTRIVDFNPRLPFSSIGEIFGMVQKQALVISMKEVYGWLLIVSMVSLLLILIGYGPVRPWAIFPKWSTIRRGIKHIVRSVGK